MEGENKCLREETTQNFTLSPCFCPFVDQRIDTEGGKKSENVNRNRPRRVRTCDADRRWRLGFISPSNVAIWNTYKWGSLSDKMTCFPSASLSVKLFLKKKTALLPSQYFTANLKSVSSLELTVISKFNQTASNVIQYWCLGFLWLWLLAYSSFYSRFLVPFIKLVS